MVVDMEQCPYIRILTTVANCEIILRNCIIQRLEGKSMAKADRAREKLPDLCLPQWQHRSQPLRPVLVLSTIVHLTFLFLPSHDTSSLPAPTSRALPHVARQTTMEVFASRLFAGVGTDEGNTLLDVLLQVGNAGIEELGLGGVNLTDGVDLLNTLGAELDLAAEEVDALVLVEGRVDEGGLNDTLLALSGAEDGLGHAGTSHGHGERGGTSTVLGLDNLVTTELDTLDEVGVGGKVGVVALAEEGNDSDTRVTADDGDVLILGVSALDLRDEAAGADNVEGSDTEEGLGVVDALGLEDLGADGDGGVDGVGDDEELGLGGGVGNSLGEIADDGGVGVEEVVTGHAGLAGDTGGDEDDLSALEALGEAGGVGLVSLDGGLGVDVGDVSSDTCSMIVSYRDMKDDV